MVTALAKQADGRQEQTRALDARESRHKVRQAVARAMSGRSLVELCLDVTRETPAGQDREGRFLEALHRLEAELGVAPTELVEDDAGYCGLFVTALPALLARRRASRLETNAAWDRELSIECYGLAGSSVATGKVPRETVGASPALH